MHHDNAEQETAMYDQPEYDTFAPVDYDSMSDRELLLTIVKQQASMLALVQEVGPAVQPMLDRLSKNPMFKMLLG